MEPIWIAAIVGHVSALLGLWLRLRSRARQAEAHRRLVVEVLGALPVGGRIDDCGADGSRLTVTAAPGPLT
jgi:hypothetical protein